MAPRRDQGGNRKNGGEVDSPKTGDAGCLFSEKLERLRCAKKKNSRKDHGKKRKGKPPTRAFGGARTSHPPGSKGCLREW